MPILSPRARVLLRIPTFGVWYAISTCSSTIVHIYTTFTVRITMAKPNPVWIYTLPGCFVLARRSLATMSDATMTVSAYLGG